MENNAADKTKEQLVAELRDRVAALEASEIERKRAVSEARRRTAQVTLIYEVGQRISSELELETLLSEIVTAIHDTFNVSNVMLL